MKLNNDSAKKICDGSDKIVIYGYGKYQYEPLFEAFKSVPGITPFNFQHNPC